MLKPFHYTYKLYSNLLENPGGDSVTPRAKRNQEILNIFKKFEKTVKVSIKLRAFTDRLFVSCHADGGGEGGGEPRAEGEGVFNSGVRGAKARWWVGAIVGGGQRWEWGVFNL